MNLPAKSRAVSTELLSVDKSGQFLTFLLAKETFAIDILCIKEIIEYGQVTEVPMMPDYVKGVINLRGRVVPVINLQSRFGRSQSIIGKRSCIVIIEINTSEEQQVIGVVVDAVAAVLAISQENIEKAPSFGAKLRSDFIQAMGKIKGEFVIILNMDKVLSLEELSRVSEVADQVDPD